MFKVHSHYLLVLTLVFSTANAPSFMFWRNAVSAEGSATEMLETFGASSNQAALPREYAEDGDIKRFQLDELYLPSLDVTLPELFNWSELDREYVADVDTRFDSISHESDMSRGASMRIASLSSGPMFGNFGGGSVGGLGRGSNGNTADSALADDTDASRTGKDDSVSSSPADESTPADDSMPADSMPSDDSNTGSPGANEPSGGTPIINPPPSVLDPVAPNPEPVPVPAPGALSLVVLGLAGLQLAGRKKKQKRLAAS